MVDGLRFVVARELMAHLAAFAPLQLSWHPWRGLQLLPAHAGASCGCDHS